MATTKKPSGLSIARNNMKFTISWKIADANYSAGQQLQWRTFVSGKWTAWTSVTIGAQATTSTVALSASNYWPVTSTYLYGIQFRIRGKKTDCDWSEWAEKTMDLTAPAAPTISAVLDNNLDNVTAFPWSAPSSSTDAKPYHSVEWQTILVKESNETDGSKLAWKTTTLGWAAGTSTSTSGTITRTEDTTLLAAASYTRWVRIRSRGCGGNGAIHGCSAWKYAKHVYARPYKAVINKASRESTNYIRVNWTANATASHPIDSIDVDYAIGTPRAQLQPPVSPSWTTAFTFRDTTGNDEAFFQVTDVLDDDECLWVRVNAHHDHEGNSRASDPVVVAVGPLAMPSGLSVQTNDQTYMATVTATNNSDVPDSELAIVFRRKGSKDIIVGYIAHGSTSASVQCPNWSDGVPVQFGVFAYQGYRIAQAAISTHGEASTAMTYSVDANMKSATLWAGGSVPIEPSNVIASKSETEGEVVLTWGWAWTSANRAELSWSDNPNAWESTDEPSTYTVTSINTAKWRISNLEVGKTWYFRVRLAEETEGGTTYGPYCDTVSIKLSGAPNIPVLMLTKAVIPAGGLFGASWSYESTDGSMQAYAELQEVTYSNGNIATAEVIAHANTEHSIEMTAPEAWEDGTEHYLRLRVTSESGQMSEWSDVVTIVVAEPLVINPTQISLRLISIDDGAQGLRPIMALESLPLTATILGAGAGGTTTLELVRAASYVMNRPDESLFNGYEGETVCRISQSGEGQMTINLSDLIGTLDDGAPYRVIATIQDDYGQSDSWSLDFEVHWTHQAVIPDGEVEISDGIAVITPVAPEDYTSGDTCDVYRLSADRPVKVLEGAEFGTDYVDPYPAVGDFGGYRFVYMTINGDYITEDNELAWLDVMGGIADQVTIIDFDGNQIILPYNLEVSNNWEKDFKETRYLGGSIQGDWNVGVHRGASVGTEVATDDQNLIAMMRRLAVYPGICHVRTPEGSSFAADVQVKEVQSYSVAGKIATFDMSITRVDSSGLDGLPLDEWAP